MAAVLVLLILGLVALSVNHLRERQNGQEDGHEIAGLEFE
jgi:hypothetical protein